MQIHLLWSLHSARCDPFAKDAAQTDNANGTSFRKEVWEAERTHREATAEAEGLGERWRKVSRDGRKFVQISIWHSFALIVVRCSSVLRFVGVLGISCDNVLFTGWRCPVRGDWSEPGFAMLNLDSWIERILFKMQWVNCRWIIITPNQMRNVSHMTTYCAGWSFLVSCPSAAVVFQPNCFADHSMHDVDPYCHSQTDCGRKHNLHAICGDNCKAVLQTW